MQFSSVQFCHSVMYNSLRPHESQQCGTWVQSQKQQNNLCSFPFNITVIQVSALTTNAEEAEVEQFYEDLQDLLELTPKKYVLFIIGDWNARVESQLPGVPSKFGQEYKMKQGKG